MLGWKARIKETFRIACIFAAVAAWPAGPVLGETLEEALAKAYSTNPTLLAARARLRATDETVAQALAGWRPTVSVNLSGGKSRVDVQGAAEAQSRTPKAASINIEQNLFNGFGTQADIRRSEYSVLADRARLITTEQDVLLDATTAYMDVLRDQAVLELNINNEQVLRRQLEATRDRFQVGEVTRTDVAQAESRLSRANADRIRAEGDLAISRARYRSIIGDSPEMLQRPRVLETLPVNEDEVHVLARNNAPDVLVARYEEQAAQEQVKVIAAELWPSVDLTGELERSDETTAQLVRTDSASILATVTVPLYQAGGVSARVREAKHVAGQRREELDLAVRDSIEEAASAWEALQTRRAQIKSFAEEVRAAEIALEGVRQEAAVGSRTTLDVLDAEQELLNARVNLVTAQRDEVVAAYALRAAIGSLTARALDLPVQVYDYTKHYEAVRDKWWGTDIDGK